jgi:hypothetical protein
MCDTGCYDILTFREWVPKCSYQLSSTYSILVKKRFGAILALEVKLGLKLKCLPPVGYNFELRKKLEEGRIV